MQQVRVNSFYAWFLAIRPKTLTGAAIPVMIGSALALRDGCFQWIPALICLFFAVLMQVAANFINDLYDFLKGSDREDRLGPERACAQGWITASAMKAGIIVTVILAAMVGCSLLFYIEWNWNFIWIGALSILFAFLYTTTLSYYGLGDILVIAFFGFAAVGGTYYVQALQWTVDTSLFSLSCGLITETLLLINNYRDRDADRKSNKKTLVVRFGENTGKYLYLCSGLLAILLMFVLLITPEYHFFSSVLPLLYLLPHFFTWKEMVAINTGKKLNSILGKTSRNMLLYGLLVTIGLVLDYLFPYILS